MTLSRSTLALLTLNAAWLAAASYFIAQRQSATMRERAVEYVTNYVSIATSEPAVAATNPAPARSDFRWSQLESEDYRTYIERLRAIGCPEQTIRDIIIADVDKLLAPQVSAASLHPRELKYWEPFDATQWTDTAERQALARQRLVDFQKREVIRELLGVDLVGQRLSAQGQHDYYGARLQFLPEEKRARVRLLLDEYGDQERSLREQQIAEGDSPELAAQLREVQQRKEAALKETLTAEERAQFDLWLSPAAARTRESVYTMQASEAEFLKLYELQREFETNGGGALDRDQFNARVQQALGPERFKEYQRAQDPHYRELHALTAQLGLPQQIAAELHGFKEAADEQRALVAADPALSPQQRQAAEQAIAEETEQAYKEVLGEKAFKRFRQRRSPKQP